MLRDGAIATWSEVVNSLADVRENVRQSIFQSFSSFPYCVLSPTFAGNYGRSKSTYLCLGDGKIGVVRAENKPLQAVYTPLSEIDALETGTELLSSWITIHFHKQKISVFFNSVNKPLYARFIDAFRTSRESTGSTASSSTQKDIEAYFTFIRRKDFKYDTYPRLVLGNRLPSSSFYHPETGIARALLGTRVISSYLLVSAGGLLYSFSEARIIRYARSVNYSMVIRYIPIDTTLVRNQIDVKDDYSLQSFMRLNSSLLEIPVGTTFTEKFSVFCQESSISVSPSSSGKS